MTDPIEVMARALCRKSSHAPQGTCAPICMDELGDVPRKGCSHALDIHGERVRDVVKAVEAAGYRLAEREPSKEMVRAISGFSDQEAMAATGGYCLMWDALPTWGAKK